MKIYREMKMDREKSEKVVQTKSDLFVLESVECAEEWRLFVSTDVCVCGREEGKRGTNRSCE
jgi:hypothetical protein